MKQIILSLFVVLVFTACADKTNFMGADKIAGSWFYTERWYLNSKYKNQKLPIGTKFYGASAEKIRNKFNIKYYQKTKDGKDNILIPKKDLWTIKHNGKEFYDQDNEKLFYYIKIDEKFIKKLDKYHKFHAIDNGIRSRIVPIKKCYTNGFCKLYPYSYEKYNNDVYIYKSILDKPLSEIKD